MQTDEALDRIAELEQNAERDAAKIHRLQDELAQERIISNSLGEQVEKLEAQIDAAYSIVNGKVITDRDPGDETSLLRMMGS